MSGLAEIKARLAAATPGPWRWGGNLDVRHVYLSTEHHGRVMVMNFERWGMRDAAPVFWSHADAEVRKGWGGRPVKVADCATREASYRGDIDHIDNPDAELIAAAPADLAWAVAEIERLTADLRTAEGYADEITHIIASSGVASEDQT